MVRNITLIQMSTAFVERSFTQVGLIEKACGEKMLHDNFETRVMHCERPWSGKGCRKGLSHGKGPLSVLERAFPIEGAFPMGKAPLSGTKGLSSL